MENELTPDEIRIILTSLEYSKRNIGDGEDSSYELKTEKLGQIDAVMDKLRVLRDQA